MLSVQLNIISSLLSLLYNETVIVTIGGRLVNSLSLIIPTWRLQVSVTGATVALFKEMDI